MILVSLCRCLCPINWSQVLSRSWRCSWSSADRRCSNYIWVIDNFIAYQGASYIRDLTVVANVMSLKWMYTLNRWPIVCLSQTSYGESMGSNVKRSLWVQISALVDSDVCRNVMTLKDIWHVDTQFPWRNLCYAFFVIISKIFNLVILAWIEEKFIVS